MFWRRRWCLLKERMKIISSFAKGLPIWMIICIGRFHWDDHLQTAGQSDWSFAKGRPLRMIICKRPAIGMITCKRPAQPDDYMQKTGPSGWSFANGQPIKMINCKMPVLWSFAKPGPLGWSFAKGNCDIDWSIRGPHGPKKLWLKVWSLNHKLQTVYIMTRGQNVGLPIQ